MPLVLRAVSVIDCERCAPFAGVRVFLEGESVLCLTSFVMMMLSWMVWMR